MRALSLSREGWLKLETAECRSLFRGVKQLHPDGIGEPTEGQKVLWMQAQEAYKYYDIEELRAIALIVDTKLPRLKSRLKSITCVE